MCPARSSVTSLMPPVNWIEMAGAARIGRYREAQVLRERFVLIELHASANVFGLRLNEPVGLIVERRKCFRGARWHIRRFAKFCRKARADAAMLTKNTGTTIRTRIGYPTSGLDPGLPDGKHYA